VLRVTAKRREYPHYRDADKNAGGARIAVMPNREQLFVPSTRTHHDGESDAGAWVFVAFCALGFATNVFLVFLSSHVG
jgi:hypothetical protein